MSAKDELIDVLFNTPGRTHVGLHITRGSKEVTEEELCATILSAIRQADAGLSGLPETGLEKRPLTDDERQEMERKTRALHAEFDDLLEGREPRNTRLTVRDLLE